MEETKQVEILQDRTADTIPDLNEAIGALLAWWDHLQDECPIERYIDTFRAALAAPKNTTI